ncbi:hypothetical protein [Pseudoalteromonas piscicida]|uniref:hypothetical protein n=1 Tax=Pseudoalteromonas piscicida TaxID=43662 RepID=UPI0030A0808D
MGVILGFKLLFITSLASGPLKLSCSPEGLNQSHVKKLNAALYPIKGEFQVECGNTVFLQTPYLKGNICIKNFYSVVERLNSKSEVALTGRQISDKSCDFTSSIYLDERVEEIAFKSIFKFISELESDKLLALKERVSFFKFYFDDSINDFAHGVGGFKVVSPIYTSFEMNSFSIKVSVDDVHWKIYFSYGKNRIIINDIVKVVE